MKTVTSVMLLGAIVATAPHAASAQTTGSIQKRVLTLAGARTVAAAAEAEARRLNTTGAIAVVDDGGSLLYLARLDNTFPAGAAVATDKARTAATFRMPTRNLEDAVKNGRTALVGVSEMTPLAGGIPIVVDGEIVGAVGVSGAANAAQDEELARVAAGVGLSNPRAVSEVTYIPAPEVAAAFAKGAVLLDRGHYMVHASRRERAGEVEVHAKDADIIYVLDGSATFVTGGEMIGGKTTAPDEVRGTSIEGGETRTIGKGDVLVVPSGTPHWFKTIAGPVLYYVVKVR
jgi:glc operon protein GlcG